MSEMTQAERLGAFFELAAAATPNSDQTLAAQRYFKQEIMGIGNSKASDAHLQDKGLEGSFLQALSRVVNFRTGDTQQMQISETYEGMMSRLPAEDQNTYRGVGHVLDKLALQCGARQADMSFGK